MAHVKKTRFIIFDSKLFCLCVLHIFYVFQKHINFNPATLNTTRLLMFFGTQMKIEKMAPLVLIITNIIL